MIERYQLRYFLAVVEAGTFSRAAQQVNVSQPALSIGIAKLEQALGGPVFLRNSRRVHLTQAGVRLLGHARSIEREFQSLEVDSRAAPIQAPIRFGVLSTIPTRLVESIVALNATSAHADTLEIVEGSERDLLSRLQRRRIDLAVTVLRSARALFETERLRVESYGLALWSGHPLAGSQLLTAEDVAGEVMIVRRHCEALQETSRFFTERGVRPRFSFRTFSEDRAAAMVRARLGVTVAPASWEEPGVTIVPLAGFEPSRELGLVYGPGFDRERGSAAIEAVRATLCTPG